MKSRLPLAIAIILGLSILLKAEAQQQNKPANHEVSGSVLILKEGMTQPSGPLNWGGLIVAEISDSQSRPPQNIVVEAQGCLPLGKVRGVRTNAQGQPQFGGGYTWYLYKAPTDVRSVVIKVQYAPNGASSPTTVKREHQVELAS